jgi:pimeloyl-ACP methyl ester carboxylesterase
MLAGSAVHLAAAAFAALSQEATALAVRPAWTALGTPMTPGKHPVELVVLGPTLTIPHCNGRARVSVDGVERDAGSKGPLELDVGPGEHQVEVEVDVSTYEKRIACAPWRVATPLVRFPSKHAGKPFAGEAVLVVPRGHDSAKPGPLLVGLHPWNGSPWTYVAYKELLERAEEKDVVLLMPSGLGNSLYQPDAEDEVLHAIEAAKTRVAVDPLRVSLWGASMGGAGATTIGFHHPERFAYIASYFGDSKYPDRVPGARELSALTYVEQAKHVPVRLVHGEDDRISPIEQSILLYDAMRERGYEVKFDRVPHAGHEGPLVVRYIRSIVDEAATRKRCADCY